MRRMVCVLVLMLCMSLAILPAAAQGIVVPGDFDGDKIVSDDEVAVAEQSYKDGKITADDLEEIKHIHENYPRTITDSAGKEVTIYRPIRRVVCTISHHVETLRSINGTCSISHGFLILHK